MRTFDKEKVVRRVVAAKSLDGDHPAPRVYRKKENFLYRVGPGGWFVKVYISKIWATIIGEKVQRVKL